MSALDSLSTARLAGERIALRHVQDIRRMHQDSDFMQYLGGVRPSSEALEYVTTNIDHWKRHGFGFWILRLADSDKPVGRGGLRHVQIESVDEVELGYGLLPQFWGLGLATELATECVRLAQEVLRLPSVVAYSTPDNAPSIRVMQNAGLVFEKEFVFRDQVFSLFRRVLA